MILLKKYEDFLERVDDLGFMALSNILPGFPSLSEESPEEIWHTGDYNTDPWRWKDRAAEEKRLAYGCILGGHKGFISGRMYSTFYRAYHPQEDMEERKASGEISQTVWQLWGIFEEKTLLNTGEIRREMGVTKKKGGSRVDKAIEDLQHYYYITVAGSRRKADKYGQPYGWSANVYTSVENWAPQEWMKLSPSLSCEEAREVILDNGVSIGKNIDRTVLAKILDLQ